MNERDKLVANIRSQNLPAGEITVTLEDFFVGNDDLGSIGCNLGSRQPSISTFSEVLKRIRSRPEVQATLVRICEFDDPDRWPYSDTVYILASADTETVTKWVRPLMPSEIVSEWMYGPPPGAPELRAGTTPFSVWWD